MRWFGCLFIAVFIVSGLWGMAEARTDCTRPVMGGRSAGLAEGMQDYEYLNDLSIGALWFPNIARKGFVGYYDISAYYPGGGDQSAVWNAGMWAGGYVEGQSLAWLFRGDRGHYSDTYQYDTLNEEALVETEADLDLSYPYRRLTVHVNTASKPYTVAGGDTVDGDMGMDLMYEWHQWGIRGYDNWVFLHVKVVFTKAIDDFYWAWLSDCDCGDVDLPNYYFDDYAGWDDSLKFCYMRDWDYDPLSGQPPAPSTEDSVFLSPNVIAQYLLAAPPTRGAVTADPDTAQKWSVKNYWDWNNDVSSNQDGYDRIAGAWQNTFPSPEPFDYRILNAVGPYDVSAGDTADFWMAFILGEGYTDDSHDLYHMGTLVEHVPEARAFFNGGMVIPASLAPPMAPDLDPDLDTDITGDTLRFHWAPYINIPGGATADSFVVYTSTAGKLGPWDRLASFDSSTTETLYGLTSDCTYFWVEAYDTSNHVGSNPYALTSRLYARDAAGRLRANENTIVCAASPFAGVVPKPEPQGRLIWSSPNPFNPVTAITYSIPIAGEVRLRVYDVSGRLVRSLVDGQAGAGEHGTSWDGRDARGDRVPSGVYFLRLQANGQVATKTVVLVE
jgi:hypothetical protein